MSPTERLRWALDTIDAAAREQRERHELTERRLAETEAKARAAFRKEIDVAMKYADHLAELTRRKKEAGGWATEKTLSAKDNVLGFGPEEADPADSQPMFGSSAESTESTTAPMLPPRRRARWEEHFDEEDFSNNSWLD